MIELVGTTKTDITQFTVHGLVQVLCNQYAMPTLPGLKLPVKVVRSSSILLV